jgi:hypothetical protein
MICWDEMSNDSIFQDVNGDGKWYFLDQVWSYAHGPFDAEAQAHQALIRKRPEEEGYGYGG